MLTEYKNEKDSYIWLFLATMTPDVYFHFFKVT